MGRRDGRDVDGPRTQVRANGTRRDVGSDAAMAGHTAAGQCRPSERPTSSPGGNAATAAGFARRRWAGQQPTR
jgi:hypothetical protein